MRILARALGVMVTLAVTLSLAASVLVTASFLFAAHGPRGYLGLHLVISGVFLLVGFLFGGIGLQVLDLAKIAATAEGLLTVGLRTRLVRLMTLLVIAGLCLCALLAAATAGILQRIGQGSAVFG